MKSRSFKHPIEAADKLSYLIRGPCDKGRTVIALRHFFRSPGDFLDGPYDSDSCNANKQGDSGDAQHRCYRVVIPELHNGCKNLPARGKHDQSPRGPFDTVETPYQVGRVPGSEAGAGGFLGHGVQDRQFHLVPCLPQTFPSFQGCGRGQKLPGQIHQAGALTLPPSEAHDVLHEEVKRNVHFKVSHRATGIILELGNKGHGFLSGLSIIPGRGHLRDSCPVKRHHAGAPHAGGHHTHPAGRAGSRIGQLQVDIAHPFHVAELIQHPLPYSGAPACLRGLAQHSDPFHRLVKTHVETVRGPLQLEHGGLFPFVQKGVSRVQKGEQTHDGQDQGDGQDDVYGESLVQAFEHGIQPRGLHGILQAVFQGMAE